MCLLFWRCPNSIQLPPSWLFLCMSVFNLYLSRLSTLQAFRVRKQEKLQLLSVTWESGFCWAGYKRSKRWTSMTGPALIHPKNGAMDRLRTKPNTIEKECSSWQQADLEYSLDFSCLSIVTVRPMLDELKSWLLATWAKELALEYFLWGTAGGVFECKKAKESSKCSSRRSCQE